MSLSHRVYAALRRTAYDVVRFPALSETLIQRALVAIDPGFADPRSGALLQIGGVLHWPRVGRPQAEPAAAAKEAA